MHDFAGSLHYSSCNEDSLTEIKALNIKETDEIICVTGSGGRVLNLLTQKPKRIVAIDLNPIQNWLLELKMAAIKNLDYDNYVKFLGLKPCKERLELFDKLKNDLSEDAYRFWGNKKRLIRNGVLYQGILEKYCKHFSNGLKAFMGEKVDKILSFDNLKEQQHYYENVWKNDDNLKKFIESHDVNKSGSNHTLYYGKGYGFDDFIYQALDKGFKTGLVRDNYYLCMVIDGSYERATTLPMCLEKENYALLKDNLDRIEIVTNEIVTYLKGLNSHTLDKFSISDLGGYLDDKEYNELLQNIIRTSRKDAILCARYISGEGAQKSIPAEYSSMIKRKKTLENELQKIDLALEYNIIIGEIIESC